MHSLAVQQRDTGIRAHYLEREPGEACAGADIDHAAAPEVRHRQQGAAVQEMAARGVLLAGDGGQVHHRIALGQVFVIGPQPFKRPVGDGHAQFRKAGGQYLFHTHHQRT